MRDATLLSLYFPIFMDEVGTISVKFHSFTKIIRGTGHTGLRSQQHHGSLPHRRHTHLGGRPAHEHDT